MADGGLSVRMKYHVYSVLANISAALPCISDWSSGLPRVTGQSFLLLLTIQKLNHQHERFSCLATLCDYSASQKLIQ